MKHKICNTEHAQLSRWSIYTVTKRLEWKPATYHYPSLCCMQQSVQWLGFDNNNNSDTELLSVTVLGTSSQSLELNSVYHCLMSAIHIIRRYLKSRNLLLQRYLSREVRRGKGKLPIVNSTLLQPCDPRARCSSPFAGLWAGRELQTQLSYMGGN